MSMFRHKLFSALLCSALLCLA